MARSNHSRRVHGPSEERFGTGDVREFSPRGDDEMDREHEERWGPSFEPGQVGDFVARNPYTSVLTGFGVGFGFGLFVTLLLTRREPSWFERYAPDSVQHLPDRLRQVPDQWKHASESLASYVPSSWKRW